MRDSWKSIENPLKSLRSEAFLTMERRRWELERQFLPLLHQVKGPVGPPSQVKPLGEFRTPCSRLESEERCALGHAVGRSGPQTGHYGPRVDTVHLT